MIFNKLDLVFLSLPNGEAQRIIKKFGNFNNLKFIDLSADFRLTSATEYKKWYGLDHKAKKLVKHSLYSISEFVNNDIKNFRIIGNPGCYPTSVQIPLKPLLIKKLINFKGITIDAKSGYSGAGKNFEKKFTHKYLLESVFAYGINKHRHTSEIDQEFNKLFKRKVEYSFNPHLLPTFRGILSSIYVFKKKKITVQKITSTLKKYYKNHKFIKILKTNSSIGTGNVIGTNNCEISVCQTQDKNKIIIFSAIDNLIKGAAGQAVQNMNLIYDYKKSQGLE